MKIIIYSTKSFEKKYINNANEENHELCFIPDKLTLKTADKAIGYIGVSCFVADYIDDVLMKKLTEHGIKFITLRSAGYDYANGHAAKQYNKVLLTQLNKRHKQFLDLRQA